MFFKNELFRAVCPGGVSFWLQALTAETRNHAVVENILFKGIDIFRIVVPALIFINSGQEPALLLACVGLYFLTGILEDKIMLVANRGILTRAGYLS